MRTLKDGINIDIESNSIEYFIDKLFLTEQISNVYYKYVNADIEDNVCNLYSQIMSAYEISEDMCKTILSIPKIKNAIAKRPGLEEQLSLIIEEIKDKAIKITTEEDKKTLLDTTLEMQKKRREYYEKYAEYINLATEQTLIEANEKITNEQISLSELANYINICQEFLQSPTEGYYGLIRSEFNNNFIYGSYTQRDFLGKILALKAKLFIDTVDYLCQVAKSLVENVQAEKLPVLAEEQLNGMHLIAAISNKIDICITRLSNDIRSNQISETNIYQDINLLAQETDEVISYIRDGKINNELIEKARGYYLKRKKYSTKKAEFF